MVKYNDIEYSIAIIAAVADDNVIGLNNDMPWRQPADLKKFRELTLGHVVIMGRNTQIAINTPLDQRINIVVSTDPKYYPDGFSVKHNIKDAIDYAIYKDFYLIKERRLFDTKREIFIMGGQSLYDNMIDVADTMYITNIYGTMEGDRRFPDIDMSMWRIASIDSYEADKDNEYPYDFVKYRRN